MDQRRRRLLQTAGIALTAGLAGCSDRSGGGSDGGGGGYGGGGGTETATATETESGSDGDETATATETETEAGLSGLALVLDNVSVQAWEVVEDESGSVAPTGEENPTLTFEVGQRYAVENRGWSAHPFAVRAADDTPLVSQSAGGEFADDADVDWVDNGETLAFTFTEALAAEADYYICTVHSSMRGGVESA